MKTVTIDIGNTCSKVDVWTDEGFLCRHSSGPLNVEEIVGMGERENVKAYIVSSVRKDSGEAVRQLKEKSQCPVVVFDNDEIERYYSSIEYKGKLGPDRLAAVLGADVIYPGVAKMVVDLGTAMTIDIADSQGNFCGGNISLGLFSRMKALAQATSKLPDIKEIGEGKIFGDDTASAISSGALAGVIGEILYSFLKAREKFGVKVGILTGGDAGYVEREVMDTLGGINDPYLVGRGLDYHLRTRRLHPPVGGVDK